METAIDNASLWDFLKHISDGLQSKRLADVFRFISFYPNETYGPHGHLRIEINYVKKGSCFIHLDKESVTFREGEIMIISSNVEHFFEAGPEGCTLMQLEFLPEIFTRFNRPDNDGNTLSSVFLFSEENRLIKITNNVRIMRTVQRIVNELEAKSPYYQHLVVMYYAELLILINRHMDEAFLPICTNESLKKSIAYLRHHFQSNISIADVARHCDISERYLRILFTQHLKITPLDYLNQLRINKSIELLRNTELSIKEISFQCGFQSPQYFSRIFKQQTGKTPREMTR